MKTSDIQAIASACAKGHLPNAVVSPSELAALLTELVQLRGLRGAALAVYNTHPSRTQKALASAAVFKAAYTEAQAPEVKARALGLARMKSNLPPYPAAPTDYEQAVRLYGLSLIAEAHASLASVAYMAEDENWI